MCPLVDTNGAPIPKDVDDRIEQIFNEMLDKSKKTKIIIIIKMKLNQHDGLHEISDGNLILLRD